MYVLVMDIVHAHCIVCIYIAQYALYMSIVYILYGIVHAHCIVYILLLLYIVYTLHNIPYI